MRTAFLVPSFVALSSPLFAVPITFEFSGQITEIIDATGVLTGDLMVGASFAGTYTFEPALVDSHLDPNVGEYRSLTSLMHVSLGAFDLWGGTDNLIRVENRATFDALSLGAFDFISDGLRIAGMGVAFVDFSAAMFSSDVLVLSPPSLSALDVATLQIEGHREQGDLVGFSISGAIDSLVPEPGMLAMCALALPAFKRYSRAR